VTTPASTCAVCGCDLGRMRALLGERWVCLKCWARLSAAALALVAVSCAPSPWLVSHRCTEPPAALGPAKLSRCSDAAHPCRACLYTYAEEGLTCRWQLERATCDGLWDLTAHECGISGGE
jgi:hypothetical protein